MCSSHAAPHAFLHRATMHDFGSCQHVRSSMLAIMQRRSVPTTMAGSRRGWALCIRVVGWAIGRARGRGERVVVFDGGKWEVVSGRWLWWFFSFFLLPCSSRHLRCSSSHGDEDAQRDARTPRKLRVVRASGRAPSFSNTRHERRQATSRLYPAVWSNGMILAPGARGPRFSSRNSPALLTARQHELATMWAWTWGRSGRGGLVVRGMPGERPATLGDLR